MADFHTGKQRAQRIDLGYHRRTDGFRSWRTYLTLVAVVGALGYTAFGLFAGPAGEVQFSHGPLAASHAPIDRNCGACHEPFAPIRSDSILSTAPGLANWLFGSRANGKDGKPRQWGRVSDAKCIVCHQETGGHHTFACKAEDLRSCASCHVDHRGRDAEIAMVRDTSCLRCHDKLDTHRAAPAGSGSESPDADLDNPGAGTIAAHVGRFYDDHPEFRSLKQDPGTLWTFSHAQHLGKGISKEGAESLAKKWEYIDKTLGVIQQPAGAAATDLIQLTCESCHQVDLGLARTGSGRASKSGEFMAPVTFDKHCSGCHQRDLPKGVGHGLRSGDVEKQLMVSLAEEMAAGGLKPPAKKSVGPGMGIGPQLDALSKLVDKSSEVFGSRKQDTHTRCAKCHQFQPAKDNAFPDVQPASIPVSWFAHGRFNHAAHTTIKCDDCHGGAAKSQTGKDVNIENKASCVNCHRPENSGITGSGARHECALCHVFHRGPEKYGELEGAEPAPATNPLSWQGSPELKTQGDHLRQSVPEAARYGRALLATHP